MDDDLAMPAAVRRVVDRMSDADWRSLTVQLGRYTLHKSRRFYWRTGRSGQLPSGEMTESIVSKALVLWMSGRRRWNAGEYEDLDGFLKGVIDSLLSHSANGHDNRGFVADASAAAALRATPETELLDQERTAEADRTLAEIVRQSDGDAVVLDIIGAIRNGAATRREIVAVTGRPAPDIDNGFKRLRRTGAAVARNQSHDSQRSK